MWKRVLMLITSTSCALGTNFSSDNKLAESSHLLDNPYQFEMIDLLGLSDRPVQIIKHPSLRSSASKFLLEVYNELSEEVVEKKQNRYKRTLYDDTNLLTELDRLEIEKSNNIITFSSKGSKKSLAPTPSTIGSGMVLTFNTNDVPKDLQLVHSVLRIYQDPSLGRFQDSDAVKTTISIYKKMFNPKQQLNEFKIFASINATTEYEGWLEFNITCLLSNWLQHKTVHRLIHGNEVVVGVTFQAKQTTNIGDKYSFVQMEASDIGLMGTNSMIEDRQPFIIGYFNGPELMAKIQKLRFKREVIKRKRKAEFYKQPPPEIYQIPKTCERLKFTLDFKELHMHNWVIAPKKFEAYFCGGECNFPLGSKMNATNHAIVQTLMHLKQPSLPKPCCVPTVLGSISILHYLNEDSVNLSKYPQSVAKECGCH